VDLSNSLRSELDVGREELDALVLVERGLDKGGDDDALLSLGGLEESGGELGSG
jgi:hypothetical protein